LVAKKQINDERPLCYIIYINNQSRWLLFWQQESISFKYSLSLLCPYVFWQLNYLFLILSVHFRIPASDYLFGIIKLAIHCWARTTWLSTSPVDLVQSRYIMWSKRNRFSRWNIWKKCSLVVKTTITDSDYLCKLYNTEVFRRLFV
jgi:hypothetical protein